MKLTCDLCGGGLQMKSGGQSAICTTCGLMYPMDRLREKLGLQCEQKQASHEPKIEEPTVVKPKRVKPRVRAVEPKIIVPEVIESEIIEPEIVEAETPQESPTAELLKDITAKLEHEIVCDVQVEVETPAEPAQEYSFGFKPEQFVLDKNGCSSSSVSGLIKQGCLGPGEVIYLDGDYRNPYKVCSVKTNANSTCAKAGMQAELFLEGCPRRDLRNARTVTGATEPEPNAYNYPGTVWEYFFNLLRASFAEYDILLNVPHRELAIPVSFMFLKDKKPVAAVFLFKSNDAKSRYQAQKAVGILATESVKCTHFYEDYRNSMSYVLQRVRSILEEQ